MLNPKTLISPSEGYISPVRHLKQVDFPAPETPNNAKHSPNSRPKETSLTAALFPKYFFI
jgi:hypothetical protein